MPAALVHPIATLAPSRLVDITSRSERARLSPAGLKAFFRIMQQWSVSDPIAKDLLGGVSNGVFYDMKKNQERVLDPDTLTRISFLLGIYKALKTIYGEKLAREWISLANDNPIFDGRAPLQYMVRGGIPAMQVVRRLLDARRGM